MTNGSVLNNDLFRTKIWHIFFDVNIISTCHFCTPWPVGFTWTQICVAWCSACGRTTRHCGFISRWVRVMINQRISLNMSSKSNAWIRYTGRHRHGIVSRRIAFRRRWWMIWQIRIKIQLVISISRIWRWRISGAPVWILTRRTWNIWWWWRWWWRSSDIGSLSNEHL